MARRPDPARIAAARRAAAIARLRSTGHPTTAAAALVEAFAADHGGHLDRTAWDGFDAWLERRLRPPPQPSAQFPQGATFRQFATVSLTVCVPVDP